MYAPFVISGILEEILAEKVAYTNTNILGDTLNECLNLNDYGDLNGITFIYLVTPPEDNIHEETFSYSRKKKELYIQMRLPYDEVASASLPEVLHLMAEKYLQTMQERLPKKKIPGFDWLRFVHDVRNLFERQGWLLAEAVA